MADAFHLNTEMLLSIPRADRSWTPGQIAYTNYCRHSNGVSLISGAPLPSWDEQGEQIQEAWEVAAAAVCLEQIARMMDDGVLPALHDPDDN